ncbi:hypothetical protein BDN72DRAFT_63964 [Pluteus cervinus]|uniref:Uncharacterized protein n=1 Tax=Pluteus cervinus TaxID=181527 RepID=A0ACD3AQS1_9AGAR|nr:hypothetical protein BDN72DRAFT_63964 [Pluteus cervinus]
MTFCEESTTLTADSRDPRPTARFTVVPGTGVHPISSDQSRVPHSSMPEGSPPCTPLHHKSRVHEVSLGSATLSSCISIPVDSLHRLSPFHFCHHPPFESAWNSVRVKEDQRSSCFESMRQLTNATHRSPMHRNRQERKPLQLSQKSSPNAYRSSPYRVDFDLSTTKEKEKGKRPKLAEPQNFLLTVLIDTHRTSILSNRPITRRERARLHILRGSLRGLDQARGRPFLPFAPSSKSVPCGMVKAPAGSHFYE